MKLILISLCFSLASSAAIVYKECSVEDLGMCNFNLQKSVSHAIISLHGNQTLTGVFCDVVLEKEGKCVTERVEACKVDHPKASKLMSTVHDYHKYLCADGGQMFLNFIKCTLYQRAEYLKCFSSEKVTQDIDYGMWTKICTGNSSVQHCFAKFVKDKCKLGEGIENAVENIIMAQADLKADACRNRADSQNELKADFYIKRFELMDGLKAEVVVYRNGVEGEEGPVAVGYMNGAESLKNNFKILMVMFISHCFLLRNKFY